MKELCSHPFEDQSSKLSRQCPNLNHRQIELISKRESTQAQSKFTQQVLGFLKAIKYTGTIEVDTLVVIKENKINEYGEKVSTYRIRFVDIMLPEIGLVIEVDGSSHDKYLSKMNCDNSRDEFYVQLGFCPPYRIDNGDALIPGRSSRDCDELMTLILSLKRQILSGVRSPFTTTRNLARGRCAFYAANQGLKDIFPHLRADRPQGGVWKKHHLGVRARMQKGRLVTGRKRRSIKKEKIKMESKSINAKKRGRPSKMRKDELVKQVEQIKKANPTRTIESIAIELGYSARQIRRIRAAHLMAELKMQAWV